MRTREGNSPYFLYLSLLNLNKDIFYARSVRKPAYQALRQQGNEFHLQPAVQVPDLAQAVDLPC